MSSAANSNAQGPSSAHKNRGPAVDTALHVIKGAIVSVLGKTAAVTASVEFSSKSKGAITILWDGAKPTPEQQQAIEDAANACIKANKPVSMHEMDRAAAEKKYTENPVNSTYIYDNFPVPAHVTQLQIVEIPEWNVNCCPGPHLATTGELEALSLGKINTKGAKLIFAFTVGSAAVAELEQRKLTKQVLTPTHAATPKGLHVDPSKSVEQKLHQNIHTPHPVHSNAPKATQVQQTANFLLEAALKALGDLKVAHDDKFDAKFKQSLKEEFEAQLTAVQNNAFANGFNARLPARR